MAEALEVRLDRMGLDMPVMTIRWTCVGSSKRESSMTIPGCLSGLLQSAHHISKRCKSCWRLLSRWQRELSKVSVKPGRRCSKVDGAWQMDVRSCFRNKSLKMSASTEFELSRTRRLWHSAETSLLWSAGRHVRGNKAVPVPMTSMSMYCVLVKLS